MAVFAAPAGAAPDRGSAQHVKKLAGHRWRHVAQVDGKRGVDRIVIVGDKDLTLGQFQSGEGFGHITVHVHLAGTSQTISSRQFISYVSPRKPWTPWFGATDLDHLGGKEIIVGFSTGAHAQSFTALTDQSGKLRVLNPPRGSSWLINGAYTSGYGGWLCTSNGVESRGVIATSNSLKHFRIVRNRYVYRSGQWVRTRHYAHTVAADSHGQPPKYTRGYATFTCPGLPKAVF
jgi:hypothetical protein